MRSDNETRQGQAAPRTAWCPPPSLQTSSTGTLWRSLLQFYELTAQTVWNQFMEATWNYVANITQKSREQVVWCHLHPSPFSPCSSQGP